MPDISPSKNGLLVTEISATVGPIVGNYLNAEQLARADALIDASLNSCDAHKLSGCMIKAFLRLPFENGTLMEALTRFVNADYIISNEKVDQNGLKATSDSHIRAGKLPSDIWSVSQVITDALSSEASPYKDIAALVGKQMAILVYACEKVVDHQTHPFDVLEKEFKKNGIDPFKVIHMFEFAGHGHSSIANTKRGVAKLLGGFHLHTGAGDGQARKKNSGFVVSLATPPGIPSRESGVNYIIARNIFNRNAVERDIDPYENVRNLLCAFSNTLPDTGRLYISTSINDAIDARNMGELLALTGFKPVGDASYCNDGQTPSYILERDFKIKGAELIIPGGASGKWSQKENNVTNTGGAMIP